MEEHLTNEHHGTIMKSNPTFGGGQEGGQELMCYRREAGCRMASITESKNR